MLICEFCIKTDFTDLKLNKMDLISEIMLIKKYTIVGFIYNI